MAAFALAALTLPGPAAAQDVTQAGVTVKSTHGDWDVVCATANPDQCTLRQFGKTADGKKVLIVRFRKLDGVKTQDGKNVPAAIEITAPLGTILRTGVKVQVDAGEPRIRPFEVCVPNGCILTEPMSEEFLATLKAGKAANMTFNVLQQGTLNVSISLKGFTKAFGKL
jgi:invasion protein IalB